MQYNTRIDVPMAGQPADLPVENDDRGILIHTELGVKIHFTPSSGEFWADMSLRPDGRGSGAKIHSPHFAVLIEKIRRRALIVPVRAYTVQVDSYGYRDPRITVKEVIVVEHHPGRTCPFVVRDVDQRGKPTLREADGVCLPTPEILQEIEQAAQAYADEENRHRAEQTRLAGILNRAKEKLPTLSASDIQYVQQNGYQKALPADTLGAVPFQNEEEVPDGTG